MADHLTITAQPLSIQYSNTPLSSGSPNFSLLVEARNADESVDTSVTDTCTVSINTNPNSGTLTGTLTQSPSSGVYAFNDLRIDNFGSPYDLLFTFDGGGVTSATTSGFDNVGSYVHAITAPSNAKSGATISPAIEIELRDVNGNRDTNRNETIVLSFQTDPTGTATLSGTTSKSLSSGYVSFSDISVDNAGTGYVLQVSISALSFSGQVDSTTAYSFNITANHLAFTQQPTNAAAGASITPDIAVAAKDVNGNTDTAFASAITLAINNNPGSSTLTTDTNPVTASSGVSTFTHTSLNHTGTGYTLDATATGLTTATSNSFDITSAAAAHAPYYYRYLAGGASM